MAKVFFSYSHDDETYRDRLEKHLAMLKRQGLITSWHDRRIPAGSHIDDTISEQLETANVVLLLVSASFLSSDYCYSNELTRAMQRHAEGTAVVVPVIVKPCDWFAAPFGKLLAAPRDGKAIVLWPNEDEAYTDVAMKIRAVVEGFPAASRKTASARAVPARIPRSDISPSPRSSNLRLKKEFTQRDRDDFLHDGFEYIVKFFEGSLTELTSRNPGVEGKLRQIDANTFTATIYKGGAKISECAVSLGGFSRDSGITFSYDASSRGNSYNEMLSVEANDQEMFFRPLGMSFTPVAPQMSHEGAAEFLWDMLIRRLQ